ncbi:MAG: hypothetical protein IKC93_04345 [Candidatus Methanomethylophilaceae archaeon]|nr:hypothetical protein [Candidatus Methanomethylophilaceae archaeon]
MEQSITVLVVFLILATLLSASVFDWKYREIPDWHWAIMFVVGIILSIAKVIDSGLGPVGLLMPICVALIAFDCLYDREPPIMMDMTIYIAIAILAIVPFVMIGGDVGRTFISIPITYAAMNVLYYTGLVRGGADAKSIIAIASVFPTYPEILGMPIIDVPSGIESQVFTPAFAVLTMALVLSLLYGVFNFIRNLIAGNTVMPQMIIGTMMPIEKAKVSKVWSMEDIVDGESAITTSAIEDDEIWKRLEDGGRTEIWVTAIIPFLIPITIAFIIMVTVGFPLFTL